MLLQKTNPEAMTEGEVEDIKAAKEKLMTDSQSLFQKVYEQAQAAGGAQGGPGFDGAQGFDGSGMGGGAQNNGGNNDDVVDADYKEV